MKSSLQEILTAVAAPIAISIWSKTIKQHGSQEASSGKRGQVDFIVNPRT